MTSDEVNVQVVVRCRPTSRKERNTSNVVNASKKEVKVMQRLVSGKEVEKVFTFDTVYGPKASQVKLFKTTIQPIVDEALMGFNCTILGMYSFEREFTLVAYGQTGSGKTYTIFGDRQKSGNYRNPGVLPRCFDYIIKTLEENKAEYSLRMSCMELYNEELQDLLEPSEAVEERKKLRIFDDARRGTIVTDLEEVIIRDQSHFQRVLNGAIEKRNTACTNMNEFSSRSHVITTLTIHIRESKSDGEELIKTGKLHLVDLAGSENIGRSGAINKRAKEAGMINQSLLTLGRVITALVEHCPHIPYRESKLTRLLRDSLGGRTKTCVIATISPSMVNIEETLSTLEYAHRAKSIKNRPEINAKCSKKFIMKEMSTDIERLKLELQSQREKNGVFMSLKEFEEKSTLIETLQDQVAHLTDDVQELQENLKETEETYEQEKNDHLQTKQELSSIREQLQTTESSLEEQKFITQEQQFFLNELKQVENKLIEEATKLKSQLEDSVQDDSLLRTKISHYQHLENSNLKETKIQTSDSLKMINGLEGALTEFIELMESLESKNSQHMDTWKNSHQNLLSQLRQQIQDGSSCFKQQNQLLTRELNGYSVSHLHFIQQNVETFNEVFGIHQKQVNETFNGLVVQIMDNQHSNQSVLHSLLSVLNSHLDQTQELVNAFSKEQQELFTEIADKITTENEEKIQQLKAEVEALHSFKEEQFNRTKSMEKDLLESVTERLQSYISKEQEFFNKQSDSINQNLIDVTKSLNGQSQWTRDMSQKVHYNHENHSNQIKNENILLKQRIEKEAMSLRANFHNVTEEVVPSLNGLLNQQTSSHASMLSNHSREVEDALNAQISQFETFKQKFFDIRDEYQTKMQVLEEDKEQKCNEISETFENERNTQCDIQSKRQESLQTVQKQYQQHIHQLNSKIESLPLKFKRYQATEHTPMKKTREVPSHLPHSHPEEQLRLKFLQEKNIPIPPGILRERQENIEDVPAAAAGVMSPPMRSPIKRKRSSIIPASTTKKRGRKRSSEGVSTQPKKRRRNSDDLVGTVENL